MLLGVLATRDRLINSLLLIAETSSAAAFHFVDVHHIAILHSILKRSFDLWKRVMKIDLMVLVAMIVLHFRKRIMPFVGLDFGGVSWVFMVSKGSYFHAGYRGQLQGLGSSGTIIFREQ